MARLRSGHPGRWLGALLAAAIGAATLGLVSTAPPAAATVRNDWSVGVFRGSLHVDYVRLHEAWLGRPMETVLEMIPEDSWASISRPTARLTAWAGTPYVVLFTTPMLPKDGGASTLAKGAAGAYDEHWRTFARTMVAGGRPTARVRLGHEFNHTHYPWNATAGKEADFAAYYRRIVEVTRSVPGAQFRFTWNVLSGVKTADVERAYPGDAYVDVISLDLYDSAGWVPDFHQRWQKYHTQPYGLDWLKRFATAHGKPMAFDEWGLIKSNNVERRDPAGDSGDDTVFINGMLDFFETENVAYACYFDWNTKYGYTDSRIMNGPYPNASAVYRSRVGGGTAPTVPAPPVTAPPVTTTVPTTPSPSTAVDVAMIVGNASTIPNGDVPTRQRLAGLGRTVTLVDDDALSSPAALGGARLVVISSSVVPGKIPTWLATLPLPILDAESYVQTTLQLATAGADRPGGTSVRVLDPTHALAAGRSGDVAVQSLQSMGTGTPVPSATIVAGMAGTSSAAIYAVEKGAALTSSVAPARRVGFFFSYESPPALTAAGWSFFDAAVRWLSSTSTSPSSTDSVAAPGAAVSGGRIVTVRDGRALVLDSGAPAGTAIVAGAATPTGAGSWSVTADGRVYTTGDAPHLGSRQGAGLNAPIVGIAPTPTARGYWLLGSDGGIFSFGDARFFGSTGAMRLNQAVVGMASTASGRGYWLFAGDGGIFTFGDARFVGSTGALRLNAPITTMAATPTGRGYWLLGGDGGVFTFGDARFAGSTGADRSVGAIRALVPTKTGAGYWLIGGDARLHAFGDAR